MQHLAYITNLARISSLFSPEVADQARGIMTRHGDVCDLGGTGNLAAGLARTSAFVQRNAYSGVVLAGGPDIIPQVALDVLPPDLRTNVGTAFNDPDNFTIWSDDLYADLNGDTLPELPISRVPDARNAAFFLARLGPSAWTYGPRRFGVRNSARPDAEPIFAKIPGAGPLLVSEPTSAANSDLAKMASDLAYFWLHGNWYDKTVFMGETAQHGFVDAINLTSVPAQGPAAVFAACCWSALLANYSAARTIDRSSLSGIDGSKSLALTFLANGTKAFIGNTGAHYAPNGGPFHTAFWGEIAAGTPPALALFKAKGQFARNIPHGHAGPVQLAVEMKTFRQFTCLGIGWDA